MDNKNGLDLFAWPGLSWRAITCNTCYGWVNLMLCVSMLIGVMLHLHTEGNATGDNFNETVA